MSVLTVVQTKAVPMPVVKQSDSVLTAVKQMLAIKESGLLILTPGGGLVGIVTEKDVMRLVAERYTQLNKIEVWEIMSKTITSIAADASLDEALSIMTEKHIHHLPLMQGEKAVGLISLDDIITARLKKTEHEAEMLKQFIQQQ
ncbi:MAG: CBS domain-containing protein [Spirochaetes bacterium]|nr:CBS domain-containing protein [Spirochaetota bacterium]MBX3721626.1 CBS domain-containing protein [Turneriella sp.]